MSKKNTYDVQVQTDEELGARLAEEAGIPELHERIDALESELENVELDPPKDGESERPSGTVESVDSRHVETLGGGGPDGSYHANDNWGNLLDVSEPVHYRGFEIDVNESGRVRFEVYNADDLGDVMDADPDAVREYHIESGGDWFPIDVTLDEGKWFVCRRTSSAHDHLPDIGVRRAGPFEMWDELNDTDAPVEFTRGWSFEIPHNSSRADNYEASGWAEYNYFQFRPEFGWGSR